MRPGFYFLMYSSFEFHPIGFVRSCGKYRFEAPRQGVFNGIDGVVELLPEYGGDAIADLAGFDRIWIIFCFHLNLEHPWKPKVRPPFPAGGACRSLFATRSPYRVNPLGLSCVKLDSVERNRILFSGADMLDGTPVLDIKPYIPDADAFPDAATGWREVAAEVWEVIAEPGFRKQAALIKELSGLDLESFCRIQLSHAPLDKQRKRITAVSDGNYALGCRTWQVIYCCDDLRRQVKLLGIRSNYRADELLPGADDRYKDKDFHRRFTAVFGTKNRIDPDNN